MAVWHYFNDSPDEGLYVMPEQEVFEKAVELLLPDLSKKDLRFDKIIAWAKEDYAQNHTAITLLMRMDWATSSSFSLVSSFLKEMDLDSGNREVIVSKGVIHYSPDYLKMAPVPVR